MHWFNEQMCFFFKKNVRFNGKQVKAGESVLINIKEK